MRIHIAAPMGESIQEQVAFIRDAESRGFAGVGVADHLEHGHDAYVTLGLAATQTSDVWLYPAVTNPKSRHPFHLAVVANTLAELAPGRGKLAMGTGDSVILNLGTTPAKVADFRDAIIRIRALVRGEAVEFGNNPNGRIQHPASPPPDVIVTGSGPRALQVAGEVGDGAMLLAGIGPRFREQALKRVGEGAEKAGRSVADIPVMHNVVVAIDDDPAAARARVWPAVFGWIKMHFYDDGLAAAGIEFPANAEKPDDVPSELVEELCNETAIAGTRSQVVERFHQLASEGVEHMYCFAFGPGRGEVIDALTKEVIPAV